MLGNRDNSVLRELNQLLGAMRTATEPLSTVALTDALGWSPAVAATFQQDAHELLLELLVAVQPLRCARSVEGSLLQTVRCHGEEPSVTSEPFRVLSLDLMSDVAESIERLTAPSAVENYSGSQGPVDATVQHEFEILPELLLLQIKRFDGVTKLHDPMALPSQLDLAAHFAPPTTATASLVKSKDTGFGMRLHPNGAVKAFIGSGGAGEAAGIPLGALITHINDVAVSSKKEIVAQLALAQDPSAPMAFTYSLEGTAAAPSEAASPCIYTLQAVMIHSGSCSIGHYFVCVRESEGEDEDSWLVFDDANVSRVSGSAVQAMATGGSAESPGTSAYLVAYRRTEGS